MTKPINRHQWLKLIVKQLQREGLHLNTAWQIARTRLDDPAVTRFNAMLSLDAAHRHLNVFMRLILSGGSLLAPQPISRYPDEPHPDNEWEWKSWWVKKTYKPDQPLLQQDIVFIHKCWIETKARWCL